MTSLARSIEEMRLSFIEQLKNEDEAKEANIKLITSMAHDLRTPLTTQIGYLDMLEGKKYTSEKQLDIYICKARDKAYQVKDLSDRLFSHFLMNEDNEVNNIELISFSGNLVLEQLVGDYVFLLSEKGWKIDFKNLEQEYYIYINMDLFRRVFDNIFSNITKYADKDEIVQISFASKEKYITGIFENKINKNICNVESNKMGLKNIERMLNKMGGDMKVLKSEENFMLQIKLPIAGV
jgi:K+-sensing histidine kinase KdpD